VRQGTCAAFGWAQMRRQSAFVRHVNNSLSYWLEPESLTDRRARRLHIEAPEKLIVEVERGLLVCPQCARRLWKLYRAPAGRWGCCLCLDLSYAVESQTRGDRLLGAIERIDVKLAGRIHSKTRERLQRRRAALQERRALLFASSPSVLKFLETDSISGSRQSQGNK
jgi:hypothetical protein